MNDHRVATHYYSFVMVIHVQVNTINLQILPCKCSVLQKYWLQYIATVIPYLTGTVNHVMMDETARINDSPYSFDTWTP